MSKKEKKEKRPLIGTGVIVRKEGRILIGLRKSKHGEGTWSLPGGHLEFGESLFTCAERETFEETGLSVRAVCVGSFTEDVFHEKGKHYITFFIIADLKNKNSGPTIVEPEKWERWEWRGWDALPEPLFLPIVHLKEKGFNPFARA